MVTQKVHWKPTKKFGRASGKHSNKNKRVKLGRKPKETLHYRSFLSAKSNNIKLRVIRRRIIRSYRTMSRNFLGKVSNNKYCVRKIESNGNLKLRISKVKNFTSKGYRMINLDCLQSHMSDLMLHVVTCEAAKRIAVMGNSPVSIASELRTFGLASILITRCEGCSKTFRFETSPKLKTQNNLRYDINLRAVWGSVATGNGASHLNEILATMDSPGLTQATFTNIEQNIGDMWEEVMGQEFLEAGNEERRLAIEMGNFHDGVPFVTVVTDGGWSKRSHKHSYNAMGGVGIIIGKETGKILYMGVRNKYCYICSQAKNQGIIATEHTCFKNWDESSQAMEADIIITGFKKAEQMHGLRYLRLVADGDSSVFARIQEEVPIWGKNVMKIECANHVCKCLRSSLEKLVEDNSLYKGKGKLSKATRIRIVSAVRCAIRMRSKEKEKLHAVKNLEHDIRNSIHHVFGNHKNCTNFCRAKENMTVRESKNPPSIQENDNTINEPDDVCSTQFLLWSEGSSLEAQEESRNGTYLSYTDLDRNIQQDVSLFLNRVAEKSKRLIENYTTNIAESWMHVRCKFDGGKLFNVCGRGSWHTRCYGGSLRMNLGPQWSPLVWQQVTGSFPGFHFTKLYQQRENQLSHSTKSKKRPQASASRWKRKMASMRESNSKKARLSYGNEAIDVIPDVSKLTLEKAQNSFLTTHINISQDKSDEIERSTRDQSKCSVWRDERRRRITASIFGSVVKRNTKIKVEKFVRRLLYNKWGGNQHTSKGLQEERVTIHEYKLKKAEEGVNVEVLPSGLIISKTHKYLGGSPDGKVVEHGGETGLIEVKNLIHSKPINLTQAAKTVKDFCLKLDNNMLALKTSHDYYYQCQGLIGITNLPWIDFVVRTMKPYQLHIERIKRDDNLWTNVMLPKLKAFYFKALLPELSMPREGKSPGIREPGVWFQDTLKKTPCPRVVKKAEPKKILVEKSHDQKREGEKIVQCSDTPNTPSTCLSTDVSTRPTLRRRSARSKTKFVGRRIRHKWKLSENSEETKWYNGSVLCCLSGIDGNCKSVYEILYDGEDEPHEVNHLVEDFADSAVGFIDL